MKKLITFLCLGFFLALESVCALSIKDRQLLGLEAVLAEIDTHYGMDEFKAREFGVKLEDVRAKYRRLIQEGRTLIEDLGLVPAQTREALSQEEFEQLLIGLAAEFRDGHFNILRGQTKDHFTVGIYAAQIDGRLYVSGFEEKFFVKEAAIPEPKKGDEVVSINGVSVQELALRLEPYISLATHESRMHYAYRFLLNRPHRWVEKVKEGDEVRIRFRRANPQYKQPGPGEKEDPKNPQFLEFEGLYHWVNSKNYLRALSLFPFALPKPKTKEFIFGEGGPKSYFSEGLKTDEEAKASMIRLDEALNLEIRGAKKEASVKSKSTAEETAEVETRSDSESSDGKERDRIFETSKEERQRLASLSPQTSLPVYTFRKEGVNIGVIRLPDYGFFVDQVRWLSAVVEKLEKLTDVLIIDQLDNGGGLVWSGAQVARLFAHEKEFGSVTIDMKLNRTILNLLADDGLEPSRPEVFPSAHQESMAEDEAKKDKDDDLLPPKNFTRIYLDRQFADELRARFERGEVHSGPIPYMGVQSRFRAKAPGRIVGREGKVYTKPILILTNSRAASCGDFFPSIMQQNRRAVVMGETSMGLGGPVYRAQDSMPGSEMFMRCTIGYCERADGLPMENLGVVPDLPRWIQPADLTDGFKSYATEVLQTAVGLAKGKNLEDLKQAREEKRNKVKPTGEKFKQIEAMILRMDEDLQPLNLDIQRLEDIYRTGIARLDELQAKDLSDAEWQWLSIPLPKALWVRDVFLSSLRKVDEMVVRLRQMKGLEKFQGGDDQRLLQFLIKHLKAFEKARRRVCFEALKSFVKGT